MTGELLPVPDPPERPPGAEAPPRWPAWYAPAAFLSALALVSVAVAVIAAATSALGGDPDDSTSGVAIVGTFFQDLTFVATALAFASLRARPRAWHFGLRRTAFWPTAGWTLVAIVAFYALVAVYTAVAQPSGEQTVVEDLGADRGGLLLAASAILVVGVAPFVEEFFFRGFFYGALRTRFGVWTAAAMGGLLFGLIHYSGPGTLDVLPPLAALGVVFCLLYERTGTLYAPIAFHAMNNSIAFAAQVEADGRVLAAVIGVAAVSGCAIAASAQGGRAPRPFGTRGWARAS